MLKYFKGWLNTSCSKTANREWTVNKVDWSNEVTWRIMNRQYQSTAMISNLFHKYWAIRYCNWLGIKDTRGTPAWELAACSQASKRIRTLFFHLQHPPSALMAHAYRRSRATGLTSPSRWIRLLRLNPSFFQGQLYPVGLWRIEYRWAILFFTSLNYLGDPVF